MANMPSKANPWRSVDRKWTFKQILTTLVGIWYLTAFGCASFSLKLSVGPCIDDWEQRVSEDYTQKHGPRGVDAGPRLSPRKSDTGNFEIGCSSSWANRLQCECDTSKVNGIPYHWRAKHLNQTRSPSPSFTDGDEPLGCRGCVWSLTWNRRRPWAPAIVVHLPIEGAEDGVG